jgi:anaerobic magnesium-protoporphyrin IX monomethyl ester cyclase
VRRLFPSARLLLGGVHAQALAEAELTASPFDAVVYGEGEDTLREILAGRAWAEVAGLGYRDDGGWRRNRDRPAIGDLDTLSLPAYDLFNLAAYDRRHRLWKGRRIAMLESSRGCPFGCSFCSSRSVFGSRWRAKSAARVLAEIERFLDLGFDEIHFQDDGFTTDLRRAKAIVERILTCGRRFPWELFNGIRIDRADEEFFALAAKAGCYRIRFGLESGDQKVLDAIGKGFALAQVREVFRLARRHGIETIALFMLALPEETRASADATRQFAVNLPCDFARLSVTVPYPGSPLHARWKNEGRLPAENWDDYYFHHTGELLFRHPHLTNGDVRTLYTQFYRRFYSRPRYLAERLALGFRRGTLWRDFAYFVEKFVVGPWLRRGRGAARTAARG